MGIALLSFADLFTPLQSLATRWLPTRRRRSSALRHAAVPPARAARPAVRPDRPARLLRVVRTVDAQQPGMRGSRMVISGRMSDVCAELDRLAALEAADPLH